jgi:hypothetical protein
LTEIVFPEKIVQIAAGATFHLALGGRHSLVPYNDILTTHKFRNELFVVYQKATLCTVMGTIRMEH